MYQSSFDQHVSRSSGTEPLNHGYRYAQGRLRPWSNKRFRLHVRPDLTFRYFPYHQPLQTTTNRLLTTPPRWLLLDLLRHMLLTVLRRPCSEDALGPVRLGLADGGQHRQRHVLGRQVDLLDDPSAHGTSAARGVGVSVCEMVRANRWPPAWSGHPDQTPFEASSVANPERDKTKLHESHYESP